MPNEALIVVDMQNDFCEGGALAVPGGNAIVPRVNKLIAEHDHVVLTQDWHPPGHASFAASHDGAEPFTTRAFPYGPQTLWPVHCVQGTPGAAFHPDLESTKAEMIVRKGFHRGINSYSAFRENDRMTRTGLDGYLKARGFTKRRAVRAGARFLRRLVGPRRPAGGLRRRGRGRRHGRHRPRRQQEDAPRDAPSRNQARRRLRLVSRSATATQRPTPWACALPASTSWDSKR